MKKWMKKITLATLAGVGALSVGFGTASLQASANNVDAPAPVVTIEQKAAIRKEGEMGIRFTANVGNVAQLETAYGEENVVYGMLITPADYLTEGKELSFDGGLTEWTEESTSATGTYKNAVAKPDENGKMYGSFIGIAESNYSRPFAARAYVGVKNAEGAFTYSYSDVCSRAVYTVASYAVMDEAQGFSATVMEYLDKVVEKVHTAYTTLNVDLGEATEFDGTNNTINLTATVSNGTRTLETGVAITSSNMTQKDFTTYEVDTLGEFTATASVGELSVNFENLNCHTLLTSNDDVYVTKANAAATATLAKVDARGRTNVLKWSTEVSSVNNAATLNFDGPFNEKNIEGKVTYVTFDFWANQKVALKWAGHIVDSNAGYTIVLYNSDAKYYNEEGYKIASNGLWNDMNAVGRWITVEVALPDNVNYYGNNQYEGLTFLNGFDSTAEIYVDNFKLSTRPFESMGDESFGTSGTILADKADLDAHINGNMYVSDTSVSSLSYVEEAAGREGVFQWSAKSANDAKSKLYIADTPAHRAWLVKDSYLTFDLYVNKAVSLYWSGPDWLIYNYTSEDNAAVKIYDEEGFLISGKKIWTSGLLNQWITFEIKLDRNYTFNQYGGLGIWSSGFNSGTNIYLDNVKVSETAIVPATTGTEGVIAADQADLGMLQLSNNNATIAWDENGIGGRTGVFKWSTESTTYTSSLLMIKEDRYTSAWLKNGSYLSFDIYITSSIALTWYGDSTRYLYNDVGGITGVKFYEKTDDTYTQITSGKITNGNFNGKWVTIEICLDQDYLFANVNRGLVIPSNEYNQFKDTSPVYLDNIQVKTSTLAE